MKHLIDAIASVIEGSQYEGLVYIAGGYVRDTILGLPSHDLDLVVDCPNGGLSFATWIAQKFGVISPNNPVVFPNFGTAKILLMGTDVECVAPRTERYTEGSRKPITTNGTLLQEVERRDFTVNSLLYNITTNQIIDMTGKGRADLSAGILRTPLDPDATFSDDPLRMLRAIRFLTRFEWKFADGLEDSIRGNAHQLSIISKERIRDELVKMLVGKYPAYAIRLLCEFGLMRWISPEILAMRGVDQNKYHHLDVFAHTMLVLQQTPPDLTTRLGALFHDVAKPQTRTKHPDKGYQFLGHEDEGIKVAEDVLTRLKFSSDEIEAVKTIIGLHMTIKDDKLGDAALRRFTRKAGPHLKQLLDVMHADSMSHKPEYNNPTLIPGIIDRINLLKAKAPITRQMVVNGTDLINLFGLTPGPQFKVILDRAQEMVDENPQTDKDTLINLLKDEFKLSPKEV